MYIHSIQEPSGCSVALTAFTFGLLLGGVHKDVQIVCANVQLNVPGGVGYSGCVCIYVSILYTRSCVDVYDYMLTCLCML